MEPFFAKPTVSVIANIVDPITREFYSRDPRYVARKAEAYLKKTGVADTAYIGPELEFFIFDQVRYEQNQHTRHVRDRLGRRLVEHRPLRGAEPGLQALVQGRVLPGEPDRHAATTSAARWSTR